MLPCCRGGPCCTDEYHALVQAKGACMHARTCKRLPLQAAACLLLFAGDDGSLPSLDIPTDIDGINIMNPGPDISNAVSGALGVDPSSLPSVDFDPGDALSSASSSASSAVSSFDSGVGAVTSSIPGLG